MERKNNGLNWFTNLYKEIEDKCLEMCDVFEKEVLKYVEGPADPECVDEEHPQEENLDHAFAVAPLPVPEEHPVQTKRQTNQLSEKQGHSIMEPNHLSDYEEITEAEEVEKENAKANIPSSKPEQSQKTTAITEERATFTPSTIHDDEFPDWEIV